MIQVLVPDSSISSVTFISTVKKRKIDEFELFGHLYIEGAVITANRFNPEIMEKLTVSKV